MSSYKQSRPVVHADVGGCLHAGCYSSMATPRCPRPARERPAAITDGARTRVHSTATRRAPCREINLGLSVSKDWRTIMGMDLSGAGGYFAFSGPGWTAVLGLARMYGWEPEGTRPPEEWSPGITGEDAGDWSGGY